MAILNPDISKIEKGSVTEAIYNSLLAGFNQAQTDTLPDYTSSEFVTEKVVDNVVTYEVDEQKINASIAANKDIALKNSAYIFASGISNAIAGGSGGGGGGTGGGLFVSISGDKMQGKLSTNYGFTSGDQGVEFLRVYRTTEPVFSDRRNIVEIDGELHLPSKGLYVAGKNVLSYENEILTLNAPKVDVTGDVIANSLQIGNVTITKDGINIGGNQFEYYHAGNSNKADVDWTMRNGTVAGNLSVAGSSELGGNLSALHGFAFGANGQQIIGLDASGKVSVKSDMDIYGKVLLSGAVVLSEESPTSISVSAAGKSLLLGDNGTLSINLRSDVYSSSSTCKIIGAEGSGHFPQSFRASHQFGKNLMATYLADSTNTGVIFGGFIRFDNANGVGLSGDGDALKFTAPFKYAEQTSGGVIPRTEHKNTLLKYDDSTSLYAPMNKHSSSLFFTTDADFYVFDKPLEGKISVGITNSKTRILDKQLFFDDAVYWQGIPDGVKHYGNAYMVNDIGSVKFSSGFAGSGWKIYKNKLSGNICATFDELTIRKKMRLYELEVQKISVTNGSLWVSDSCSGDIVEEIM